MSAYTVKFDRLVYPTSFKEVGDYIVTFCDVFICMQSWTLYIHFIELCDNNLHFGMIYKNHAAEIGYNCCTQVYCMYAGRLSRILYIYVTLDHKPVISSTGIFETIANIYIVWAKMIDFSFMPKPIMILSKDHVP